MKRYGRQKEMKIRIKVSQQKYLIFGKIAYLAINLMRTVYVSGARYGPTQIGSDKLLSRR